MSDDDSIGSAAGRLRSVAVSVPAGAVNDLVDELERIRDELTSILGDTHEAVGQAHRAVEDASAMFRSLVALRARLHEIGEHHTGGSGGAAPVAPTPPTVASATSRDRPSVDNSHGDHYPVEAAGLVEQLPKRVTPNAGERTVGVGKLADRILPPMSSGHDPVWSPVMRQRLQELDIDPDRLGPHVELKLAAMMIDTRQSHAEVAINYTPCGVEAQRKRPDTCDKVLPLFLPAGSTLTVYGTTQDNEPFRRTYEGRA